MEEGIAMAERRKIMDDTSSRFRWYSALAGSYLKFMRRRRGLKHKIHAAQRVKDEDSLIGHLTPFSSRIVG